MTPTFPSFSRSQIWMALPILSALLLCLTTTSSYAQDWELVYQNDAQGKTVFGTIDNLKSAVRQGHEIRIGWGFQHPEIEKVSVEHIADAAFLTIQSDSIVYAQIRPIYGQTPDF